MRTRVWRLNAFAASHLKGNTFSTPQSNIPENFTPANCTRRRPRRFELPTLQVLTALRFGFPTEPPIPVSARVSRAGARTCLQLMGYRDMQRLNSSSLAIVFVVFVRFFLKCASIVAENPSDDNFMVAILRKLKFAAGACSVAQMRCVCLGYWCSIPGCRCVVWLGDGSADDKNLRKCPGKSIFLGFLAVQIACAAACVVVGRLGLVGQWICRA